MSIDLRQLRFAVTAAETSSFLRAAIDHDPMKEAADRVGDKLAEALGLAA